MDNTPCSPEDFDFFMNNKDLLKKCLEEGILPRAKPADCAVGLVNQGSTCYLNSVIQCLSQNPGFLKAVFTASDASSNPIIIELKKLFTFMVHSIRNAVNTKELLTSFGWSNAQIHDQHDAHEFFGILFDALSKASPLLEGRLHDIFRGSDAGTTILLPTTHNRLPLTPHSF